MVSIQPDQGGSVHVEAGCWVGVVDVEFEGEFVDICNCVLSYCCES